MTTKAELIVQLAQRRFNNFYWPNLTRLQIRQAAQGLTDAEWDAIIASMRRADPAGVGNILTKRVEEHLMGLATDEMTLKLADDLLSTDDLLELL